MKLKSVNAFDAKIEILRILYTSDYHHAGYSHSQYGFVFVYFCPEKAKFSFELEQRAHSTKLLKRFNQSPNMEEALRIAASKYTFAQIAIGACLSRKLISQIEFFKIAQKNYEWI